MVVRKFFHERFIVGRWDRSVRGRVLEMFGTWFKLLSSELKRLFKILKVKNE